MAAATSVTQMSIDDGPDRIWSALRASGCVLLKAAAVTVAEFERVTELFATRFRVHQDPERPRYNDADTTQGVSAGTDAIALHAERAYLPDRPELLFFCCLTPPASGGATTVCDGAAVLAALSADDVQRLSAMTLVWRTSLPPTRWMRMWGTRDPHEPARQLAEAARSRGGQAQARHWFEGDTMYVEHRERALHESNIGQRTAFANYLLLQAMDPEGPQARQANQEDVPADLLGRVAAAAEALTVDISWEPGDIAFIDNTRCMHGRRAFAGSERQILVRMGDVHPRLRPPSHPDVSSAIPAAEL